MGANTLFFMMLGFVVDTYREEMEKENKMGTMFIYLFFVVMQLVLLNMILAIIFDVYAEVKATNGNATTIFDQAAVFSRQKFTEVKHKGNTLTNTFRNRFSIDFNAIKHKLSRRGTMSGEISPHDLEKNE